MAQEKQVPLFADMPDSPLPPLHLLDNPEHEMAVLSAETLEFTSRLIERKLKDFGVEVKVKRSRCVGKRFGQRLPRTGNRRH